MSIGPWWTDHRSPVKSVAIRPLVSCIPMELASITASQHRLIDLVLIDFHCIPPAALDALENQNSSHPNH